MLTKSIDACSCIPSMMNIWEYPDGICHNYARRIIGQNKQESHCTVTTASRVLHVWGLYWWQSMQLWVSVQLQHNAVSDTKIYNLTHLLGGGQKRCSFREACLRPSTSCPPTLCIPLTATAILNFGQCTRCSLWEPPRIASGHGKATAQEAGRRVVCMQTCFYSLLCASDYYRDHAWGGGGGVALTGFPERDGRRVHHQTGVHHFISLRWYNGWHMRGQMNVNNNYIVDFTQKEKLCMLCNVKRI